MTLRKIDKNMIDPKFVQEVQDTSNKIGILTDLETSEKTDLVGALNEVTEKLGEKANKSQIQKAMSVKISQGSKVQKPCLVLSFDDGRIGEYTKTKPLLDSLGVKGTIYHNLYTDGTSLTKEQILEMYNAGWEFGSHTRNHVLLDRVSAPSGFTAGDTTISVNGGANGLKLVDGVTTEFYIYDSNNLGLSETVQVTGFSLDVFTLATPLKNTYPTPLIRYSDAFIEKQLSDVIDFFEDLNIPCKHFAYPYGSSTADTQSLVSKYYASGRNAALTVGGATVNGGIVRNTEVPLDQFSLSSGDLGGSTTAQIDTLLGDCVSRNGLVMLLGHASNYDNWASLLTYTVNKARALGIEIVTMSEAMDMHSNLIDLGSFKVSRSGRVRGSGFNVLPTGSVTPTSNVWDYQEGFTAVRVEAADTLGFPTSQGTLLHLATSRNNELAGWATDFWIDKNGAMYMRRSGATSTNYSTWQKFAIDENKKVNATVTTNAFTIGSNSLFYLELLSIGTNDATFNYAERIGDHLQTMMLNSVFVIPKVKDGICYLMVANKGTTTYNVPAMSINVTANKF